MNTLQTLDVGLHEGVPELKYHADPCAEPSLSSTIARTLFDRSPYHAWREHPRLGAEKKWASSPAMSMGTVVHALMSGVSDAIEIFDYDDFRSKAAQAARDFAIASGKTPVLQRVWDDAHKISDALKKAASTGNSPENDPSKTGKHEVTAVWREKNGILCRARFDALTLDEGGYATIHDWKTTSDATPERLERNIVDMGYHVQAAFYLRGLRLLKPEFAGRYSFIFYFIETDTLSVVPVTLSSAFLSIGEMIAQYAIDRWGKCLKENRWPSYCEDGQTLRITPPTWFLKKVEEKMGESI